VGREGERQRGRYLVFQEVERDREKEREMDRETDRQTDREREVIRCASVAVDVRLVNELGGLRASEWAARERQREQRERETERETGRETETKRHTWHFKMLPLMSNL
jgi:hypothetical protein